MTAWTRVLALALACIGDLAPLPGRPVPRAPGPPGSWTREWTTAEYRPRRDDGREAAGPRSARVVRGASHGDPPETLRVTIRRFYSYDGPDRGLARGHRHVGFRGATSEDLGGY